MREKLEQILVKALEEINAADAKDTLEAARVKYLGKKGELTAILRGMGDSKHPFIFISIAAIMNLVLDIVFVAFLKLGAGGAALATVISQAVSVAMCIWWLNKKMDVIHRITNSGEKLTAVSGEHMKRICVIGLPLGLEYSVCSIGKHFPDLLKKVLSISAVVAKGSEAVCSAIFKIVYFF